MKRGLLITLLLIIPAAVSEAADLKGILDKIPLRHKWHVQCDATACQYKSSYKPPAPFGAKNEAVMTVEVLPLKQKNLDIILKSETADIRKTFEIDEEASEEDGKSSNRGIAIWKENFDGAEAGFIRYRARSEKAPPPHFFTTIQGIVLGPDHEYLANLITFYAGHQDEIRADQVSILKTLAKSVK